MTRPTRLGREPIMSGPLGSVTPAPDPDPDPGDPIDYALPEHSATVQVAVATDPVALVQDAQSVTFTGTSVSATLGATPTAGNMLIAVLGYRSTGTSHAVPTGWSVAADVQGPAFDGGRMLMFYKIAGSSESATITVSTTSASKHLYVAEWAGITVIDQVLEVDNESATTSMTVGTITPIATAGVIFAGFNQSARNTPDLALQAPFTEVFDVDVDASGPAVVFGYRIVAAFSGSYSANATSDENDGYGAFIVSFGAPSGGITWQPAPATTDGDNATYDESDATFPGSEWLQVALEVARLIYRVELRVGHTSSGSKTLSLYGSTDAAFTSPVLLDTVTFSATGSFTADDVTFSWVPTTPYQFYRIESADTDRRVYDINLFSATSVVVVDHSQLTGRDETDQHDATAVSVADSAGWFTGTNVESGLAELAAKAIGYQAHGNLGATKAFAAAIGWHSGTLNANCTFTLTAAPTGTVSSLFLELAQDGTGGWTITLPASVTNKTDLQAAQVTTAGTTSFLVLLSRDGGTTWYGGWWGSSGGGSSLTVADEGSPLATDATTLDFVGAGVTATGAGATKTITIPGGATSLDDLSDVVITGPAEDDTLRYVGGTFINDSRRWEPVTFNFGSGPELVWDGDDLVMEWKDY